MASPATSRHFTLEPLAEGVWAAIHRVGGWAVGNAGIVDLGDATLLFDTFLTPDAARDLAAAAVDLTGRPPAVIVLSHYHNDHVRGAQAFPGVPVVASGATRGLIDTLGRDELASDLEHAASQFERTTTMVDDDDPTHRAYAAYFAPYWEGLVVTAPQVTLRLPTVTFDRRLEIHGSLRTAEVISLGAGHTPDDAVLVLSDDGIVFCGDLLFVGCHPYLADGDPDGWLRALDSLGTYGAKRFVPGHGAIGAAADVTGLAEHIRTLQATAERLHRDGASDETVEGLLPSDASAAWEFAFPFYRSNVRFLLARERAR